MAKLRSSPEKQDAKTLYYFQFFKGFFSDPKIRRLEKRFGSDGIVVYLKLAELSLSSDGCIERHNEEVGESFAEEIAFNIDMDEDLVANTIKFCMKIELIVPDVEDQLFHIPYITENLKTITYEGIKKRRQRARKKMEHQNNGGDSSPSDIEGDTVHHKGDNVPIYKNKNQKLKQNIELENNDNQNYSLNSDILFDETDVSLYGDSIAATGGAAEAATGTAATPLSESELVDLSEKHKVFLSDKGISAFSKATHGGTTTYWNEEPSESPLKIMRAWAKKNRTSHPEWFKDQDEEKEAAADPEDKPLPVWHYDSPNYCDYTDDDYDSIADIVNEYPEREFDNLKKIGTKLAKNKGADPWIVDFEDKGEGYAARYILLKHEKKYPGILSNEEIAAAFSNFDGYEDEEFYKYFLTHRS